MRLTDDVVGELAALGERVGLSSGDVLQLHRRVLVVEGPHDEIVVRRFYAPLLKRSRTLVIPLSGLHHFSPAPILLMARLGKPVVILADSIREQAVRSGQVPKGMLLSNEEKQLRKHLSSLHAMSQEGPVHVVPFEDPDILTALPAVAIRELVQRFGNGTFTSREALLSEWRRADRPPIKGFFVERFELDPKRISSRDLVPKALEFVRKGQMPAETLRLAIDQAVTLARP